jgi:sorbitol-specific phosphotransferase system component IIA
MCLLTELHRTCSEQCDAANLQKKAKPAATVSSPFVQPAPAKAVGKPAAQDTPEIGMQTLKVKTRVEATIPGSGTMAAVITKVTLDKKTQIYWYTVKFEDGDVLKLKQGVRNKKGKPAKKNEIVPMN